MATVVRVGKKWRARVRLRGVDRSRTFRTKREAERWAVQVEQDIEAGAMGSARPFGDALERYRDEISRHKDGGRWERLRIDKLLGGPTKRQPEREPDPLAGIRMDAIGPEHFADWRDRRLQEVSPATVLRDWNLLSSVCNRAVREWRWLASNPMSLVSRPKPPPPRTRRVTDDEIERVLLAADYEAGQPLVTSSQRVAAAFLFAIETAMRAGEICALRFNDVDLDKRVAIVRAVERGARKTGQARSVPLSHRAVALVRQAMDSSETIGDGRLFRLKASNLDAVWRKLRDRAAIDGLHFHDTRAEALTRLSRKLDVMQLAKVSGHRDLKQLLNTYYREDPADFVNLLD